MSQQPLAASVAVTPAPGAAYAPLHMDTQGALRVATGGINSALDVTAATVIKSTPGRVVRITVLAAATAGTFGVYDTTTTSAAATANAIIQYTASWPAVGTMITLDWPCLTGIVVNPGTNGAVSVSFS